MFTDCYCTQFRRSSNALTGVYDAALRPVGLKITQFSLLRGLRRLGAATFTEVAKEVALDKTTISRNLAILIREGWVTVKQGADARIKLAELSPSGADLLSRAEPYWAIAQQQIEQELARYLRGPAKKDLLDALETLQALGAGSTEGV